MILNRVVGVFYFLNLWSGLIGSLDGWMDGSPYSILLEQIELRALNLELIKF